MDRCKSRENLAKTRSISFVFSIIPQPAPVLRLFDRRTGLFALSRRLLIRLNSTLLLQDISQLVHTIQQTMLAESSNRKR